MLSKDTIQLGATADSKADAIRQAGELLVNAGCVEASYVDGMLAREKSMSTFVGNGVAIPHGEYDDLSKVIKTGISVLQLPDGVHWEEDKTAFLVIGIASQSDEHIGILMNLATALEEQATVDLLASTDDPEVILEHLNRPVAED